MLYLKTKNIVEGTIFPNNLVGDGTPFLRLCITFHPIGYMYVKALTYRNVHIQREKILLAKLRWASQSKSIMTNIQCTIMQTPAYLLENNFN